MDNGSSARQLLEAAIERHRLGDLPAAYALLTRAIEAQPGNPQLHRAKGDLGVALGRPLDAAHSFQAALSLEPRDPETLNGYGIALRQLGEPAQAERAFREAIAIRADYVQAHCNLGNALQDLGRYGEAVQCYTSALSLQPDLAEAHNNLGEAFKQLGRLGDAEACYRRALAINPGYPSAYNNLGLSHLLRGAWTDAIEHLRRAVELQPQFVEAHSNLGYAFGMLGRYAQAEAHLRHALGLRPGASELHNNLGNVLERVHRPKEAEQSYRNALQLKPDYADAMHNLGLLLEREGRLDEAAVQYRSALAAKPAYVEALASGAFARQRLCDWSELQADARRLRESLRSQSAGVIPPFVLLGMPGTTAAEQYAAGRRFAERDLGELLARPPLHAAGRRNRSGPLRVGYLSADYFEHATSYLLVEVIEQHDRNRFEVFGYSYSKDDDGPTTRRIRGAFDVLRHVGPLPDDAAARQIADDGIDILVDLKGYTRDTRMRIPALRPAPLQVSWLGYPGTLGHPRLADYVIGDPVVTPPESAEHFSEALALMPHCYQPNDRRRALLGAPTRAEAGLPAQGFVFCSFNQSYKIQPAMFDLWCELLRTVHGSWLWLLHPPTQSGAANLRREAEARGVDSGRLLFAQHLPQDRHIARLRLADLALDTFPYTSHTTASDALWAGVPLLTLCGNTFAGRVAASVLHAARMPALVTHQPDAYRQAALRLATEPERLHEAREALAANRSTCPLFDSARFTKELEGLLLRMWAEHEAGRRGHLGPAGS